MSATHPMPCPTVQVVEFPRPGDGVLQQEQQRHQRAHCSCDEHAHWITKRPALTFIRGPMSLLPRRKEAPGHSQCARSPAHGGCSPSRMQHCPRGARPLCSSPPGGETDHRSCCQSHGTCDGSTVTQHARHVGHAGVQAVQAVQLNQHLHWRRPAVNRASLLR